MTVEALFKAQHENQIRYGRKPRPNQAYINSMLIALNEEVAELARELAPHWKTWRNDNVVNVNRVVEESADVFIFVMNILLAYGITAEEYGEAIKAKQMRNRARPDHTRETE